MAERIGPIEDAPPGPVRLSPAERRLGGIRSAHAERAGRDPEPRRADLHLARGPHGRLSRAGAARSPPTVACACACCWTTSTRARRTTASRRWRRIPNIEVRMFNPWVTRKGTLAQAGEGALSFKRINRRMHNKSWIADNRIAVVGGRNVGDEYFGAGEDMNFVDLDFAMLGPIVRDVSANSTGTGTRPPPTRWRCWTRRASPTLRSRGCAGGSRSARPKRRRAATRSRCAGDDLVSQMIAGEWPVRVVIEVPVRRGRPRQGHDEEAGRQAHACRRARCCRWCSRRASGSRSFRRTSCPGEAVTAGFTRMAGNGKAVRVLTNSLVANDVAAVHGGYSRYRKPLLKGGVELWELKPAGGEGNSSLFGSSGASLHTKAFVVDGEKLFVGSYNLDPRSTWLNCEQGVMVEDAVLATSARGAIREADCRRARLAREPRGRRPALERREGVLRQ